MFQLVAIKSEALVLLEHELDAPVVARREVQQGALRVPHSHVRVEEGKMKNLLVIPTAVRDPYRDQPRGSSRLALPDLAATPAESNVGSPHS
jgi:hypothetical protein